MNQLHHRWTMKQCRLLHCKYHPGFVCLYNSMHLCLALIPEQRIAGINRDVKGKLRLYRLMFDERRQEERPACRSVSELASSVSFLWPNTQSQQSWLTELDTAVILWHMNRITHEQDSIITSQQHSQFCLLPMQHCCIIKMSFKIWYYNCILNIENL